MDMRMPGSPIDLRVVAAGLGIEALALLAFTDGRVRLTLAIAIAPVVVLLLTAVLASDGVLFVCAALALELTLPVLNDPLPLTGGTKIYPSDLVVGLALGAWLLSRLKRAQDRRGGELPPAAPRLWSPALGLPLALFAVAIASAAIRGHSRYGEPLLGAPVRMVLYAAIAAAIFRAPPHRLYRGLVFVFYAGAVWQLLNAAYYAAVGGSQSIAEDLSTGGTRLLSVSVSLYLAGTFFLALINLAQSSSARAKLLHGSMLLLSGAEIVLAYSRGTFLTVGVLALVLIFFLREVRFGAVSMLPFAAPVLVLAALVLARTHSTVIPTLVNRLDPAIVADPSVQWRGQANHALWEQVREAPLFGVGFGRTLQFTVNNVPFETTQDAHNDFLYLLAASGIFGLGSFLLVIAVALRSAGRRYRGSTDRVERALILFAVVTALSFLLNGLVEPLVSLPTILLGIWTLLLLPASVASAAPAAVPAVDPRRPYAGVVTR
jgi:O-antigen ligase